jgi:hypothetical protein
VDRMARSRSGWTGQSSSSSKETMPAKVEDPVREHSLARPPDLEGLSRDRGGRPLRALDQVFGG